MQLTDINQVIFLLNNIIHLWIRSTRKKQLYKIDNNDLHLRIKQHSVKYGFNTVTEQKYLLAQWKAELKDLTSLLPENSTQDLSRDLPPYWLFVQFPVLVTLLSTNTSIFTSIQN